MRESVYPAKEERQVKEESFMLTQAGKERGGRKKESFAD
jgi:hypothetical protein